MSDLLLTRFCSGAISREAAWAIAYHRGMCASRLSTSEGKYGMAAVGLSSQETEGYINKVTSELGSRGLVVGCVNSPRSVTVSGVQPQIDRLCNLLEQAHVFAKKLRVGVAYHSFQMHEVSNEYLLRLKEIPSLRDSKQSECCAIISSVTGTWISADEVRQPEYWVRNLVSPVLFSDAVEKICQPSLNQFKQLDGAHRRHIEITDLLEVGPHSTLQGPIRGILDGVRSRRTITYTSMLVRNHSATKTVLEAMGRLHCLGHSPSLAAVNVEKQADRVVLSNLPEYLFDHSRAYWYESRISKGHRFRPGTVNDLLGVIDPDFNPLQAKWRNIIRATNIPWIEDHKVRSMIIGQMNHVLTKITPTRSTARYCTQPLACSPWPLKPQTSLPTHTRSSGHSLSKTRLSIQHYRYHRHLPLALKSIFICNRGRLLKNKTQDGMISVYTHMRTIPGKRNATDLSRLNMSPKWVPQG